MALSTSASVTTTVTEEVKLTPKQKVQLRKNLKLYAEQHLQEKAAKVAKAKAVAEVRRIREEAGVSTLEFEGFKTSNVPNEKRFFDKKFFVQLGGDLEIYNEANSRFKPGKAYEKVTIPGEKPDREEEE